MASAGNIKAATQKVTALIFSYLLFCKAPQPPIKNIDSKQLQQGVTGKKLAVDCGCIANKARIEKTDGYL